MKVFLVAFVLLGTTAYSDVTYTSLRFCDCGQSDWRVSTYAVNWQGNNTLINMDVICNTDRGAQGMLHKVQVNISNCESPNLMDCRNSTTAHVSNVSCQEPNITEMDKRTCDVAMMIVNNGVQNRLVLPFFLQPYGICFCGADDNLTANNNSGESVESPEGSNASNSNSSEVANASNSAKPLK